jgi:RND family efflux transporter MFP subunit
MRFIHRQSASEILQWHFIAMAIPGLALMSLAVGCHRPPAPSSDPGAPAAPAQPPAVKIVHPERKDLRRSIERPGYNIEAFERTPLYAKIPGYVQKWNFDIGARVQKGDILAELYIPEMDVELKQKEASTRQAAAEIEQANAVVQRAQAELERAKSQYERLAQVGRSSGVLNKEQVDEARLGFEAAQAAVAKAQADVDVAKARLEVAQADRDHVQTLLQYTKIRAPFDGVVTQRGINTDHFVQPASGSKGDSLFVVEKVDPVRVFVNVQELEAVWVREGDSALIRPQSLPGQQFKGKVTRTAGALHPQNRTLRTEIDLPNGDGKLLPGMYVTVTIIVEHKNVWALPAAAVVTQGEQSFCYCLEKGKTVRTPLKLGIRDGDWVEVLQRQAQLTKPGEEGQWMDFTGEEEIAQGNVEAAKEGQPAHTAQPNR